MADDQQPPDVLAALPRTRPHRRSGKRPSRTEVPPRAPGADAPEVTATDRRRPARAKATSSTASPAASRRSSTARAEKNAGTRASKDPLPQPAQPRGTPEARRPSQAARRGSRRTEVERRPRPPAGVVGTAVQAAAELAEIGLSVSARALRGAVSRLPRP